MSTTSDRSDLRYLEPERVAIGGEGCEGMTIRASSGEALGRLHGFVVDPAARRLRYFVVKTAGMLGRTKLLPLAAARVDVNDRAIEVDEFEFRRGGRPFSRAMYPTFADDDLLTALFRG